MLMYIYVVPVMHYNIIDTCIFAFRFVPDLDDIVCFEDLMKDEGVSCMPEETVASARCVCESVNVYYCMYMYMYVLRV